MFDNFIEKDGDYKLLEQFSKNGRTFIVWFNSKELTVSAALFSDSQPNAISKHSKLTRWGYPTKFMSKIEDIDQVASVTGLYIKDIKDGNFWWEDN